MIVERIIDCDQRHLNNINHEYITWLDSALFHAWLGDKMVDDEYFMIYREVDSLQFSAYNHSELLELFDLLDNNGGFRIIFFDDYWIIKCNKPKLDSILYGEAPDSRFLNFASYYDWAKEWHP